MTQPQRLPRLLPQGVRDIFGAPARQLTTLRATLLCLLDGWGYHEVYPPTFEYFETVMRAFDSDFAAEIYRVVDPDGQLLALRPDLTVPIARLVAAKLFDQPTPHRMSYVAPVFRFTKSNGSQSRQIWQAGWELIGDGSAMADAEAIALLIAAIEAAGLTEFQVNLGHMGFIRATLAETDLSDDQRETVLRAIDRKNRHVLLQTLDESTVSAPIRAVFAALPDLWGGAEVLDTALTLAPTPAARSAIDRLREVYQLLQGYGVAERITLDLGEVRAMDYYTGVTFELFAKGSGYKVASGGRYDNLLARFGADLPAVGAMIELEPLMTIYNDLNGEPVLPPADALYHYCTDPACLRDLYHRRQRGERIELDSQPRSDSELQAEAARRGIGQVIVGQHE
jgi:ATP phosphoribosyltransferase regulatory subunit